jgi:hypothetical protein
LKEELTDITNSMSQNIDDILKRGENLEDLGQRSRTLKNSSKVFEKQAKWLRMCKVRRRVVWCVLVICCCCWWCCCLRGNGGSRIQMGCVLIVVLTV